MVGRDFVVAVVLLVGCGDDGGAVPVDAMVDAAGACPSKSPPLAPGMHRVYLNFEGVTLTDACASSSQGNCSNLVKTSPADIPPYMMGDPQRDQRIGFIVQTVQTAFAAYSLDIVTQRPTSGDYHMVVLGGDRVALGYPNTYGVAPLACNGLTPNLVSLQFDVGQTGFPQASDIISDIAAFHGFGATDAANHCSNRFVSRDPQRVCVFGAFGTAVPTAATFNCGRTSQDESMLLQQALGCR